MRPEKTTKATWPVACAMIKRGTFKIDLLKVSPLAQPTFVVYRGNLIVYQDKAPSLCLSWLEEHLASQPIG